MDALEGLANDARVVVRRKGVPDVNGRCIVYWMRRSMRGVDNPALDAAISAANALGKPIVVFFGLVPVANANLRHYSYLVQALGEIQQELHRKGVGFVLRRYPDHSIAKFCCEVGACLLVVDESPLRGTEQRLRRVVRQLRIPVWSVDADVVVPSKLIGSKQYAARVIRPKLAKLQKEFLVRPKNEKARTVWQSKVKGLACEDSCLNGLKIDRSVQAVKMKSGTNEALRLLQEFITKKLEQYPRLRNHPEVNGTSHLSPYLHFGQISPVRIAMEVENSTAPRVAKDAFLDQLITWRELAINFVRHNEQYDSIECAEPWAQRTLAQHAGDPRPVLYNERQLENAETYDHLWNAAQFQMVEHGWMHNYMRMYWAKKILEWTRSPAEAFQVAVRLNDKYEVDGRDPNGYAGIAWAIAGKLDRPWFDRPIFGQIRYMSGASTGKKFDSKRYIAQNSQGQARSEASEQANLFAAS
jgi:deoxyribodipyrimidine photo-lyase